jgi:PAS domain S-box-containing protein
VADTTQTVLLVDDCLEDRIAYCRYLLQEKPHSCIILEAQTGEEAFSLCKQQFPDVILLGYDLPDMDGLEFLEELKIQFKRTYFPVIILTEEENLEIAVQVMKNGAAEYLVKKNITPESLCLAVENVQEQSAHNLCQQAEETLQVYAAELEELYHHAPCGYHSLNAEGTFIRINDTELKMLGYNREELIGKKKFSDLLTPESIPSFQENFPRFKQQGWVQDLEFQVLCKDGKILPVSVSGKAIKDATGNYLYSRSIIVDISDREAVLRDRQRTEEELRQARDELEIRVQERTAELVRTNKQLQREIEERQQAEAAVLESERRLSTLINNLPGYVYRVANDTNYTPEFISQNVFAISEYKQEEYLVERTISCGQDVHPDDAQWVWDFVQQAVTARQPYECEYRIITKSGTQKWVWERGQGIYAEDGELLFLEGFVTDISDRKRDEVERQNAEQKIQEQAALLDIASDAIFVRDLEHNILFWNSGAERLYGWTAAETIGRKANEFLCQNIVPQMKEILQTVLESGSWLGELQKLTESGKEVIVSSRMTLVRDKARQPKSILTVDTDITEKKQLEAQFYRAQRLESIGTLASGIAHDMNNILTPILGFAQLLTLEFPDLDQQNRQILEIITKNAKRGAKLIEQILSFSRGESEKRVVVQLKYLLKEIEQIIKQTFPKSIEISSQRDKTELWTVSANPTQIYQVLMNLCVNARDAMPNGGQLTIAAENKFFDENYARMNLEAKIGNYVVITVSDTGCGMAEEIKESIFDPFFTTKESGKGTGLGLATVIGIVKNHGGFVNVQSEIGQGSQFQVCLPAIDTEATQDNSDSQVARGNGELILVVDDEAPIREITQASLVSYNYQVLTAFDAVEAFSVYAQNLDQIALVLMDMQMPSISGLNAIRVLRQMNPSLKVIAMSGLDSNRQLLADSQIEVQAFLLKPYTIEELLDTIQFVKAKAE